MPRPQTESRAAAAVGRWLTLALLPSWVAVCGCRGPRQDTRNPLWDLAEPPEMPKAQALPGGAPTAYVPMVRVHLIVIQVPIGTVSESEQLWSRLNEEAVRQAGPAGLGANGFRIGIAPRAGWAELARVLKRMTGRKHAEYFLRTLPGNPLHIAIKRRQPVQTVFVFHGDRTLSGSDYPPGDNLLTILCTFDEDDPNRLIMTGCPQVRSTRRVSRIVRRRGQFTAVPERVLVPFRPLTFRLTINSGDLIVIGPGLEALRPSSVGHHFLTGVRGGIEFESVFVLIPTVQRAPVKQVPAPVLRPLP